MIVEGLVNICQDGRKLQCKNHLTANTAMFLLRMLIGSEIYHSGGTSNFTTIHLMGTFQIRMGSGLTQVPAHDLTALETEVTILTNNTNLIQGDYDEAEPFDMVYSAQIDPYTLCSDVSGVTIDDIKGIIAIASAPPLSPPSSGDTYIVGDGATGAFAGHETEVATWSGSDWSFDAPTTSTAAYITDLNATYRFDGTDWVEIPPIRECGLFTYGFNTQNNYRWSFSYKNQSNVLGNAYWLAAYISANGDTPDFAVGDINMSKALTIEWTIRVAFAGDQ